MIFELGAVLVGVLCLLASVVLLTGLFRGAKCNDHLRSFSVLLHRGFKAFYRYCLQYTGYVSILIMVILWYFYNFKTAVSYLGGYALAFLTILVTSYLLLFCLCFVYNVSKRSRAKHDRILWSIAGILILVALGLLSMFLGGLTYLEGVTPRLAFVFGFILPSFIATTFAQVFFKSFELSRLVGSKFKITEVGLLDSLRSLLADASSNLLIPGALGLSSVVIGSFVISVLYPGMGLDILALGLFGVGVLAFLLSTAICTISKLKFPIFFRVGLISTAFLSLAGYLLVFAYWAYEPALILPTMIGPALFLIGGLLFLSKWYDENPQFFAGYNLGKLLYLVFGIVIAVIVAFIASDIVGVALLAISFLPAVAFAILIELRSVVARFARDSGLLARLGTANYENLEEMVEAGHDYSRFSKLVVSQGVFLVLFGAIFSMGHLMGVFQFNLLNLGVLMGLVLGFVSVFVFLAFLRHIVYSKSMHFGKLFREEIWPFALFFGLSRIRLSTTLLLGMIFPIAVGIILGVESLGPFLIGATLASLFNVYELELRRDAVPAYRRLGSSLSDYFTLKEFEKSLVFESIMGYILIAMTTILLLGQVITYYSLDLASLTLLV